MSEQQELAPKGAKKPKAKEPAWGEARILAALRERFAPPAYAFFPHVRNQTGYSRTVRTADAVAMSLFPSRGLSITGVEVKSDRHDWVRELRDPAKADEIAQHCDYWVLAVGDRDIVQAGELPESWGLLAPAGKTLKMHVEPKQIGTRDARIDRLFLAAILRRAMEDSPAENAIKAAVAEAERGWRERHQKAESFELEMAQREAKRWREDVAKFERDSGLKIHDWSLGRIGDAARALASLPDPSSYADNIDAAARELKAAAERVRAVQVPPLPKPAGEPTP